MKKIILLIVLITFSATSYSQIKVATFRDSSGTIVPVKAEQIKVIGVVSSGVVTAGGVITGNATAANPIVGTSTSGYMNFSATSPSTNLSVGYELKSYGGKEWWLVDNTDGSFNVYDKDNLVYAVSFAKTTGAATFNSTVGAIGFNSSGASTLNSLSVTNGTALNTLTASGAVTLSSTLSAGATGVTTFTASGAVTLSSALIGNALIRGQKAFGHAAKVDTLVVSGIKSGDYFVVSPVLTSASDTTGFKTLWVKSVTTDTVFVIQTTSAAYIATKYNYFLIR